MSTLEEELTGVVHDATEEWIATESLHRRGGVPREAHIARRIIDWASGRPRLTREAFNDLVDKIRKA